MHKSNKRNSHDVHTQDETVGNLQTYDHHASENNHNCTDDNIRQMALLVCLDFKKKKNCYKMLQTKLWNKQKGTCCALDNK